MARRHRLRKLGPRLLARLVRDAFVRKVRDDLDTMVTNYRNEIRTFLADAEAKLSALVRLTATYLGMLRVNYPERMKEIYDRVLGEYEPRARRAAEEILARVRVVV